jgi:recombination protein RecT
MFSDRGETVGYYSVFKLRDGSSDSEDMTVEDVEKIRNRSKSGNNGPWKTDYDEMAKKTVIKRLLKRAPMSIELADAVQIDNRAAMGESTDDIIDVHGVAIDDTPEATGAGNDGLQQTLGINE